MQTSILVFLLASPAACGPPDLLADLPDAGAGDGAVCTSDMIVYLNRTPTTFSHQTPGDSVTNTSPIVSSELESVTTTGAGLTDEEWSELVACVRGLFARYDIEITDVDPGTVEHAEIALTQSNTDIGQDGGAWSIAVCNPDGAVVWGRVAFAFMEYYASDPGAFCVGGVASAIGTMLGLPYVSNCDDVMADPVMCGVSGDRTFVDLPTSCSTYPGCATCEGTQNSHQTLLDRLGPTQCGGQP